MRPFPEGAPALALGTAAVSAVRIQTMSFRHPSRTESQSLLFDVNGLLKSLFQSPVLNQPHRGSDKGQDSMKGSHCEAQGVDSDRPTARSSASPSPLS